MPELLDPLMDAPRPAPEVPGQARLFDLGEEPSTRGLHARDGADRAARDWWFRCAEVAIRDIAGRQSVLTVLDLRRELAMHHARPWPMPDSALGVVLEAARRAGVIEHSGGWCRIDGAPVTVWRSLQW